MSKFQAVSSESWVVCETFKEQVKEGNQKTVLRQRDRPHLTMSAIQTQTLTAAVPYKPKRPETLQDTTYKLLYCHLRQMIDGTAV